MKPVVLVQRNIPGDAFQYARYCDKERTHAFELPKVPVGTVLETLSNEDVELLRIDPAKLAG